MGKWPKEAGKEAGMAGKLVSETGKWRSEAGRSPSQVAKRSSCVETYMFPKFLGESKFFEGPGSGRREGRKPNPAEMMVGKLEKKWRV